MIFVYLFEASFYFFLTLSRQKRTKMSVLSFFACDNFDFLNVNSEHKKLLRKNARERKIRREKREPEIGELERKLRRCRFRNLREIKNDQTRLTASRKR